MTPTKGKGPFGFRADYYGVRGFFDCLDELLERAISPENLRSGFAAPLPMLSVMLIGAVEVKRAIVASYDRDNGTVTLILGNAVTIAADQIERYVPTLFYKHKSTAPRAENTEPVRYVVL